MSDISADFRGAFGHSVTWEEHYLHAKTEHGTIPSQVYIGSIRGAITSGNSSHETTLVIEITSPDFRAGEIELVRLEALKFYRPPLQADTYRSEG